MAHKETINEAIKFLADKTFQTSPEALKARKAKANALKYGPCPDCFGFTVKRLSRRKGKGTGVDLGCKNGGDPISLFPLDWLPVDTTPTCGLQE